MTEVAQTRVPSAAAATAESTEARGEAFSVEFNRSIGWVPVVGTVYNGLRLVSDFLEFSTAVANLDPVGIADEVFDMAIDVIGMIPVVGGPLAAFIYQTVLPVNSAPVFGALTVGTFTAPDGTVTGQVSATDADGDRLTYSAPATTAKGGIGINATSGMFAYTPTVAARVDAGKVGAPAADKTDNFVVTVSDGRGGITTMTVTVAISPTPGSAAVIPAPALAARTSRS